MSSRTITTPWAPRVERGSALAEELYHRGLAFGIPGEQVDGMDVTAVKDAGDARAGLACAAAMDR